MKNQQIIFTSPGVAELVDREIPTVGDHQVLVRLAVSAISSGTERANLSGEINISIYDHFTEAHFPRACGYSSSGVVEKVGAGVKDFKPGDRIAVSWGTHSRYLVLDEDQVHHIPDEVSHEEAALALIGTFPLAAIRKCHLEIGESAIVMGQGVLGMIAVQLLKAAGAVPIIAADPSEEKRKIALKNGADYALDPYDPGFASRVIELTEGGAQVAIEVTGIGKALDQVLDCMRNMGRVALLGCTRHSDFTIDYYHKVHGKGISLIGAHTQMRPRTESSAGLWTTHDDIMTLMKLEKNRMIRLGDLIQETHKPEEAFAVYDRLMKEKTFPVVEFN